MGCQGSVGPASSMFHRRVIPAISTVRVVRLESLSGTHWDPDQVPAMGDPAYIVKSGNDILVDRPRVLARTCTSRSREGLVESLSER
jgi:hypothetical protein